jgi:hypothetical protein
MAGDGSAEVDALRARIAKLEDENARWKDVNNKLLARMQAATAATAGSAAGGTARPNA